MEAMRIIKTIEHTNLQELMRYMGQQVEIIVLPVGREDIEVDNKSKLFALIDRCAGHVESWIRDELYDR